MRRMRQDASPRVAAPHLLERLSLQNQVAGSLQQLRTALCLQRVVAGRVGFPAGARRARKAVTRAAYHCYTAAYLPAACPDEQALGPCHGCALGADWATAEPKCDVGLARVGCTGCQGDRRDAGGGDEGRSRAPSTANRNPEGSNRWVVDHRQPAQCYYSHRTAQLPPHPPLRGLGLCSSCRRSVSRSEAGVYCRLAMAALPCWFLRSFSTISVFHCWSLFKWIEEPATRQRVWACLPLGAQADRRRSAMFQESFLGFPCFIAALLRSMYF